MLYQRRDPELNPPSTTDGFRLAFTEPLRGFEDWELPARAAAIGELAWRYPIPIDAGWASTLYLFPASLLRTLELQLFGSGALVTPPGGGPAGRHFAGGASLDLYLVFLRVPVLLRYQASRRLTDDEAVSQQVGAAISF
jgi:hypothetical protein